jgi:asparagine synthase (glutamine-hydrolysing)
MCGIAGIVDSRLGAELEESTIRRMCDRIAYRGPDDEGLFVKNGAGLGMRRLSIIDVAGGHQPVFNEDGTVWIVYNGEVYNFPDLRPGLEAKGHIFRTHTDTEVILHLYEEMGAECVQKLRGMFAFAIYDERKHKLLLARDRMGKKPLHYALENGRLWFASEIKSILEVAPEFAEVNDTALWQYMYLGYVPDPATAFQRIHKLPPGHVLEFHDGKIKVRQYWDLPQYATYHPKSEEQCLEEMEHRLEEAVRIRLISDVPLGAMLSGGTDSSVVVALMARASAGPVKTFSIGFKQADFNEAEFARLVAEKFGTDHHELILEPNVVETVEALTRSLEEPFGDSSMLPTYYVSQLARQHVTVALSGDGGDELFAGYERYRIHLHERSHSLPEWAGKFYRGAIHPLVPYKTPGRNLAYSISLPWQERYLEGVTIQSFIREMKLLTPEFRARALANGDDSLQVLRGYLEKAPARDALSRVLYLDTKTYLAGDILTKVDRMSMLTSLEARAPILDHEFVEWVASLPPEWKMRGGEQKYIFRKLAERVGVPREVLFRKKQGFALPLVHWMRNELKPLILDVLLDQRTLQRGYFEEKGLRRLLDEHFQQRRDHSARIWRFLILELWHRNFLESLRQPAGPVEFASSLGSAG